MDNNYKFFKGTVSEFKTWLTTLSHDTTEEGIRKYNDIKNSIIYISNEFNKLPENLNDYTGAIYSKGVIIGGSNIPVWDDSDSSIYPPR